MLGLDSNTGDDAGGGCPTTPLLGGTYGTDSPKEADCSDDDDDDDVSVFGFACNVVVVVVVAAASMLSSDEFASSSLVFSSGILSLFGDARRRTWTTLTLLLAIRPMLEK